MVVSPILRGMLGIEIDAITHTLKLQPHVPATWSSFTIRNLSLGDTTLDIAYIKTADEIVLQVKHMGTGNSVVEFAPAISQRAKILRAEIDGHVVSTRLEHDNLEQHVIASFGVNRPTTTLRIKLRDNF